MPLTPTLSELLSIPTAADFRAQILSNLAALGFPVTSWEPDGVANNLIEVFSQMLSAQSQIAYPTTAGGFLDTAAALKKPDGTDDQTWLSLLAWNVYGVQPLESTAAEGPVLVTNNSSVPLILAPGDLRLANPAGYTYTSTTGATVLGGGGTATIAVRADQPGSTGTAYVGELEPITPLPNVTATNTADLIGTDGESNAALAARCRERLALISPNGSAAAYDYCLRTADDGAGSLGITRTKIMPAPGTGAVALYVQNEANTLTSGDPTVTAAQAYVLAKCTPDSVTPSTYAAPIADIVVTATYTTTSGAAIASSQFEAALVAYYATLPIGGLAGPGDPTTVLPLSGIIAALQSVPGVAGVAVSAPAADVPLMTAGVPYVPRYNAASAFTKV